MKKIIILSITLYLCIISSGCTFSLPQKIETSTHIKNIANKQGLLDHNSPDIYKNMPFTRHIYRHPQDYTTSCTHIGYAFPIYSGYLLTAKHLFDTQDIDTHYFIQDRDQKTYPLYNRRFHSEKDLALISFENENTAIELAPGAIHTGDIVRTSIDFGKYNTGTITALSGTYITTSLDLIPSYSGSPLLDQEGKLIGINRAISNQHKNISYALTIDQDFIDDWIREIEGRG